MVGETGTFLDNKQQQTDIITIIVLLIKNMFFTFF